MMIVTMMAAMALAPGGAAPEPAQPAQRARANLSLYFSTDDYPLTSARRGVEGEVSFKLDISPDGHVTECTVTRSSGDAALDAATCSILLSRAEYVPARDAAGGAVAGTDIGSVIWRLPPPEPRAVPARFAVLRAPVRLEVTFGAAPDGQPVCAASVNGAAAGADGERMCTALMTSGARRLAYAFPRDSALSLGVAISLDGETPPPAAAVDRGRLFFDSTARFSVGADGRASDCRIVGSNVHHGRPSRPPDLCTFPGLAATQFPTAPAGAAPRSGVMRLELHVRTGPPRPVV